MGEAAGVGAVEDWLNHHPQDGSSDDRSLEFDIYPLNGYYFGSKDAIPFKNETLAERVQRMKSKFVFFSLSLSLFRISFCNFYVSVLLSYFIVLIHFFFQFVLLLAMLLMDYELVWKR